MVLRVVRNKTAQAGLGKVALTGHVGRLAALGTADEVNGLRGAGTDGDDAEIQLLRTSRERGIRAALAIDEVAVVKNFGNIGPVVVWAGTKSSCKAAFVHAQGADIAATRLRGDVNRSRVIGGGVPAVLQVGADNVLVRIDFVGECQ